MSTHLFQLALVSSLLAGVAVPAAAQERGTGTVTGTVTRRSEGSRLAGVSVTVKDAAVGAVTGPDGRFVLQRVPDGPQTLLFRWLGNRAQQADVQVTAGGTVSVDVALEAQPVTLGEVVVEAPSRAPERVVEAPALLQGDAAVIVGVRLLRLQFQRAVEVGQGVIQPANQGQREASRVQGGGVVRPEREGVAEGVDGLTVALGRPETLTVARQGLGVFGLFRGIFVGHGDRAFGILCQ